MYASLDAVLAETRELEAEFAFDQQLEVLSVQRDELDHLQNRAKDILGLLTLAGAFIGAFAKGGTTTTTNAGLLFQELSDAPGIVVFFFAALPLVTFACCLFVLWPRTDWIFNISGHSIVKQMQDRRENEGFANKTRLYVSYVRKLNDFARPNAERLRRRGYALWTAITALAIEVLLIAFLVLY